MPILNSSFQTQNLADSTGTVPSQPNTPFKITSKAGTDIWRRLPDTEVYSAPIIFQHLADVSKFEIARVTFRLSSAFDTLYDQAGLVFRFPENDHWVKTGLEISSTDGTKSISTVAAGKWADWGLYPLPTELDVGSLITMEIKKEEAHGVWVYLLLQDGAKKVPLREITWAFAGEGESQGVELGAYAARPSAKLNGDDFEVEFEDFHVVTSS